MDTMLPPTSGKAKTQVPPRAHLFTAVLLFWVVGYALARLGGEPYPAIIQPSFGYVADAGDTVEWTEIEYVVTFTDGDTEQIDFRDFYGDAGDKAEYIALRVITPDNESDAETVAWVGARLDELNLDGVPSELRVQVSDVTIPDDLEQVERAAPEVWAVVEVEQ